MSTITQKTGGTATEQGVASILIELKRGHIEVRHGSDGTLLAWLRSAPPGSWSRLWEALDELGFQRRSAK